MRTIEEAAAEASNCTRCALAHGRTQVVYGVGDANADLMFIGEAPGFHEDKQGEPFVGAAGQLLTRSLAQIGMKRGDVYIANVIKCRPPGNRDPLPEEIEACNPWLIDQVSLIQPKVICTLGNFATKFVLNTPTGITRLRGRAHAWHGRTVVPTFHPAAILRGGGEGSVQYRQFRDDLELVRGVLDGEVSVEPDIDLSSGREPLLAGEMANRIAAPPPSDQLELF